MHVLVLCSIAVSRRKRRVRPHFVLRNNTDRLGVFLSPQRDMQKMGLEFFFFFWHIKNLVTTLHPA